MSFKIFGVVFNISYIFALSLTLFIAFDRSGNFIPLLISVFIHECSHLIVMCFLGAKPKEISLSMGTINIVNSKILTFGEEIVVLLAGPISNFILFILSYAHNINFANINLILFVLNLLFVKGLDGGSILKLILEKYLSLKATNNIMKIIKIINIMLFITFFLFCLKQNIKNYTILFFVVYILIK